MRFASISLGATLLSQETFELRFLNSRNIRRNAESQLQKLHCGRDLSEHKSMIGLRASVVFTNEDARNGDAASDGPTNGTFPDRKLLP